MNDSLNDVVGRRVLVKDPDGKTHKGIVEAHDPSGKYFVLLDDRLRQEEDADGPTPTEWAVAVADWTSKEDAEPKSFLTCKEDAYKLAYGNAPSLSPLLGVWHSLEDAEFLAHERLFCFCGRPEHADALLSEDPLVQCSSCKDWFHQHGCAGETIDSIFDYEKTHDSSWDCAFCRRGVASKLRSSMRRGKTDVFVKKWREHTSRKFGLPNVRHVEWEFPNGSHKTLKTLAVSTRRIIRSKKDRVDALTHSPRTAPDKRTCRRVLPFKRAFIGRRSSTSPSISKSSSTDLSRGQRLRSRQASGDSSNNTQLTLGRTKDLEFKRSPIHAFGVFAKQDIKRNEFVIEYVGEIVSNEEADKREKSYQSEGLPDYMFRVDKQTICDATKKGSLARFLNHSCSPNCVTQIIESNGQKKIAIYAKKDVAAGEELTYDYCFDSEDSTLPCTCGALDCRGFMA